MKHFINSDDRQKQKKPQHTAQALWIVRFIFIRNKTKRQYNTFITLCWCVVTSTTKQQQKPLLLQLFAGWSVCGGVFTFPEPVWIEKLIVKIHQHVLHRNDLHNLKRSTISFTWNETSNRLSISIVCVCVCRMWHLHK